MGAQRRKVIAIQRHVVFVAPGVIALAALSLGTPGVHSALCAGNGLVQGMAGPPVARLCHTRHDLSPSRPLAVKERSVLVSAGTRKASVSTGIGRAPLQ